MSFRHSLLSRLREDLDNLGHERGHGLNVKSMPMPSTSSSHHMPDHPAGVVSLHQWGRTLLSFGKLKGKKMYVQLPESKSAEDVQYKADQSS